MRTRFLLPAVAVAAFGCRHQPGPRPPGVAPTEPAPARPASVRPAAPPPARETLIGEMCPGRAGAPTGDRPAVVPVVSRKLVWSTDPEELARPIATGAARQFTVLAWDGRRAGVFSVAGAADVGLLVDVAIGTYAGAPPCSQPPDEAGSSKQEVPACVAVQGGCGLALSALEPAGGHEARPFEELPDVTAFDTGGACVAGGMLLVDVDRDGEPEAFPAASFLDAVRGPAEEVTAVDRGDATCAPAFALAAVIPPGDPRDWLGLDLLGVVDLDADGRMELIVLLKYPDRRTWAVYAAPNIAARLELVAESLPWQR